MISLVQLQSLFVLIVIGLTLRGPTANADELRGVLKNNEGVKKFQNRNGHRALEDFSSALSDLPYSGDIHFNLGDSFLIRREMEKATTEFELALKHAPTDSRRDRATRFRALFNLATIQAEQKNNDKALELYQKALEIDPESVEVKTNMELLTQQDSGGGGGQDDNQQDKKNDKDKKGGEGDKKDDQKNDQNKKNDEKFENPRPTPRPYKSEEISQQDMKRILEELKRQEGNIRARMDNERKKEAPAAKDW